MAVVTALGGLNYTAFGEPLLPSLVSGNALNYTSFGEPQLFQVGGGGVSFAMDTLVAQGSVSSSLSVSAALSALTGSASVDSDSLVTFGQSALLGSGSVDSTPSVSVSAEVHGEGSVGSGFAFSLSTNGVRGEGSVNSDVSIMLSINRVTGEGSVDSDSSVSVSAQVRGTGAVSVTYVISYTPSTLTGVGFVGATVPVLYNYADIVIYSKLAVVALESELQPATIHHRVKVQ